MKPLNFHSHFKEQMENFVNLRRLSGTDYQSQIKLLEYFDDFLVQKYPDPGASSHRLTRDMVEGYLDSDRNQRLSKRGVSNRFSVVRQFAHYLSQFDPLSYVPASRSTPGSNTSRLPYIYKITEIRSLLAQALKLTPSNSLRPHTYYTLFGILYTTGLRIGEALALNIEDFEQESNLLHIREGKFRKSRWVPLSTSAGKILQEYIDLRQRKSSLPVPLDSDSPIFISLEKKRLHQATVFEALQSLLKKCGIPKSKSNGPRIHDFRHTFAVHRLIQWYRSGEDVNARMPALATYMGHVNISSTQIYLQATAELLAQGNQRFLAHFRKKVKGVKGKGGGFYD